MKYTAVRLVFAYSSQESMTDRIDASLAQWADAGWTLHSQSTTMFVAGGGGPYPVTSTHENRAADFQKEVELLADERESE